MDHCKHLVLDEADCILDMGSEVKIRTILEKDFMPRLTDPYALCHCPVAYTDLCKRFSRQLHLFSLGPYLLYVRKHYPKGYLTQPCTDHLRHIFVKTKKGTHSLEEFFHNKGHPLTVDLRGQCEYALRQFRLGNTPIVVATPDLTIGGYQSSGYPARQTRHQL